MTQFISWSHDNYLWIYPRKTTILRVFPKWIVGSEATGKNCFLKSQVIRLQSDVKNFWQVEWLCYNNFFMSLGPYLYHTIYFVVIRQLFLNTCKENDNILTFLEIRGHILWNRSQFSSISKFEKWFFSTLCLKKSMWDIVTKKIRCLPVMTNNIHLNFQINWIKTSSSIAKTKFRSGSHI